MTDDIDRLIETLADDATAVKAAPNPVRISLILLAAAVVYVVIMLVFSGTRPDLTLQLQQPWFLAELVALLAIAIATAFGTALLAFPDLHQQRRWMALPASVLVIFILTLYFAGRADTPPAPVPEHTFECTLSIALVLLLPAIWTFFMLRRFASTHYRLAGGIALLFAFSLGALWLRLYEVNDSMSHVIQWHYLPMLGIGLVGFWLGRVLLKW